MKHPQHILAFDKTRFGIEGCTGFVGMSSKSFFEYAARSLIIARREELEKDERYAQLLPYIVLTKHDASDLREHAIFTYQRGQGVGESRLAGASSVGVGGHVDLADVCHANSVIDIVATIAEASSRELREEMRFIHIETGDRVSYNDMVASITEESAHSACMPVFRGIINDTTNPVGRVHYGVVLSIEVPDGWDVECAEEELKTMGFRLVDSITDEEAAQYENWSRLIIELFNQVMP